MLTKSHHVSEGHGFINTVAVHIITYHCTTKKHHLNVLQGMCLHLLATYLDIVYHDYYAMLLGQDPSYFCLDLVRKFISTLL